MVSLLMVHQPQYTRRNMQVICDFLFLGSSCTGFFFLFCKYHLNAMYEFKGLRARVLFMDKNSQVGKVAPIALVLSLCPNLFWSVGFSLRV